LTTPTFCCGFECGLFFAGGTGHHQTGSGTPTFNTSIKRSGSRALRCNATGAAVTARAVVFLANELGQVGRFYVYFDGALPNGDCSIHCVGNVSSPSGPNVRFQASDSKLYAAVDTTLGASGVTVTTGQWYRIDFNYLISLAGNDLSDVNVDGISCGQATALGTGSGTQTQTIGVIGAVTADIYFDDTITSITADDYPIGAGYVNHFIPTADGTHNIAGANDFEITLTGTDITNATTNAYQLVDDIPLENSTGIDFINLIAPPNATDYVEVSLSTAPGIVTPTAAPRAAEFLIAYRAAATQGNNLRVAYRDNNGGTQDDALNVSVGSTSMLYTRKQYASIPGGGAWTVTAFNNSRARCYTGDAAPDPYVHGYMIEAEWQTVAVGDGGGTDLPRSRLVMGVGR